jgi:16S rRNA (guanine527-N7)-methyltransferase
MAEAARDIPPLPAPAWFEGEVEALGIRLDEGDVARLGRYLAILLDANTRFNLTAITDPEEAWRKHILDSLTLMPYLASAEVRGVIDVGAGGGVPGVPLAIVLPDLRVTLLEATGKKARFLEEVARLLQLRNVDVVNQRAETAAHDRRRFRERFDAALARALGPLAVVLELTLPFVRTGGFVFAVKGARAAEEVAAAKQALHRLHAEVADVAPTPTGRIVVIEKRRGTPRAYPRPPGEPKRKPIG